MVRSTEERVSDALDVLSGGGDAWLATAGERGPHLVPLSLAWDEASAEIIFCTDKSSRSVRNIEQSESRVRVAIGGTRDVNLFVGEARVDGPVDASVETAEIFAAATGWDPRGGEGELVFVRVKPSLGQAWRDVPEIDDRVIMRKGVWLVE